MFPQNSWSASILQASVSDREGWSMDIGKSRIDAVNALASAQIAAGDGAYALGPEAMNIVYPSKGSNDGASSAVSANRWHSLAAKGGHEDYFSSDLTDEEMAAAFKGLRESEKASLFAFGDEEQYVAPSNDKLKLLERFKRHAGGRAETVLLKGADHTITAPEPQREFVYHVAQFLDAL